MRDDRHELHFTARSGWINDPLGVTWRGGRYHLFFQHVPGSTAWALGCHWGHAASRDLLHWEEEPIALSPGDGDEGVWSGSIADGTIFFTSVRGPDPGIGRIRRASPLDAGWLGWRKETVVLDGPPGAAAHLRRRLLRGLQVPRRCRSTVHRPLDPRRRRRRLGGCDERPTRAGSRGRPRDRPTAPGRRRRGGRADGARRPLPGHGPVQVLRDGPILELWSPEGVFALVE